MRKSKWLKLIAAVLCVTVLLLALVACVKNNDDKDDNKGKDPKPVEETLSEALDTTIQRLKDSYVVGDAKYFSVDVLADAELNKLGESSERLWKYEVLAKANIKLVDDATEDETSMRFEFNAYSKDAEGKDVKTTLFGILYENEVKDGKTTGNYFYITIAGAEPIKTNALSMYKLLSAVAPEPVADLGGIDIGSLIPLVLSILVSDFEAVDNDYIFTLNVADVWNTVYELINSYVDLSDLSSIGGMIGGTAGDIINMVLSGVDGAIADIFPGLTYTEIIDDDYSTPDIDESEEKVLPVNNIESLLKYVNQNMPNIVIRAGFNFDTNNKFESASVNAKYQAKTADDIYNNPTHEFILNADKVYVGAHNGVVVDEGYALTKDERLAKTDVVNLLNFSINGTLEMTKRGVVEVLPYSINADIDPFVLINGITVDTIKDLGYLNITVDAPENQSFRNILTIHADFSSGSIYLNLKGYANSSYLSNLNIGGKLDINALFDAITIMSGGKVEVANVANVAESTEDDTLTNILNIVLGMIDISDIANNGVVIDVSEATLKNILSYVDLGDGLANFALPGILSGVLFNGASTMAIKVNEGGIKYGECERVNLKDINFTAFRDGDVIGVNDPALDEGLIKKNYEYGQPLTDGITWNGKSGDARQSFNITGTDVISGKNVTMSAKYLGTSFDPNKVGSQKIRIYFGSNNAFNSLGGAGAEAVHNLLAGLPMLPINGVQYVETTVTVYEPVDNGTAFVNIRGVNQLGVGENVAEKLQGELIFENGRKVNITSDMISSKTHIIENGLIMYPGEWTLDINYYSVHATVKVVVGELFINNPGEIKLGVDDVMKVLNPRIKLLTSNGTYEYANCDTEILKVIIDGKEMQQKDVFINGTYKVKNNHDWLVAPGKDLKVMTISLQYDMFGEKKVRDISFDLQNNSNYLLGIVKKTVNYNSLAVYTHKIIVDGNTSKPYKVNFNSTKNEWEAYCETENKYFNEKIDVKFIKEGTDEVLDIKSGFRGEGKYKSIITIGDDAYLEGELTVYDPIAPAKTTAQVVKDKFKISTSIFTIKCDGTNLVAEGSTPKSDTMNGLSFRYDAVDGWGLYVQLQDKEVNGKNEKQYQRIESKVTYADAGGQNITPTIDKDGYVSFAATGMYKVTLTLTIGGKVFTATRDIDFTLSA